MNNKAIGVLEYQKIIDQLKMQAGSAMTKQVISELQPFIEQSKIKEALAETDEAVQLITHKGPLPLGNFYDISKSLSFARKAGTLTMLELLKIQYNLRIARETIKFLKGDLPPLPIIQSIGEVLFSNKDLEEDLARCILSEEEIWDHASPTLRNLRKSIGRKKEELKHAMDRILHSSSNREILRDSIVTIRDGRYVIPVKVEHKGKVPGIIHDQSASGATLFIEPQVMVNMNNQLRQLEAEEREEILAILTRFSERVAEGYHGLSNNQNLLVQLDLIMAKGKLSSIHRGEAPDILEGGVLELKEARHPLINPKEVVPIHVKVGGKCQALIITGPNTGGKTVTLKTCGLLAMMAQTGLHIPAASTSRLPVFQNIFADIGDEQSIEQSLSTFSSHMSNIVDIVKSGQEGTLILLDELGAGTDPTEGAALAISILEQLIKQKGMILATTHYTELKKYALSNDHVENASMEFNIETLSPSYRLIMGTPGKSNAFEISKKLGLSAPIIDHAKGLLEGGDLKFEEVIGAIEEDKKRAEEEREEAIAINLEMKRQREELEKERKSIEKANEVMVNKAKEQARDLMEEAKEISKEVKEELRELSKIESMGERNKKFDANRKKIKDAAGRYKETFIKEVNDKPVSVNDINKGDRVKVLSLGQNGEILSMPDDKEELLIQVGMIKARVHLSDLKLIPLEKKRENSRRKQSNKYASMYSNKSKHISPSLDVRGLNLDEAVDKVGSYLDNAFMASLSEVTIIHGRGTLVLQKGIRKALSQNGQVANYRKGAYNEGGDGVTIVTMDL